MVLSGGQRETIGLTKGFHPLFSIAMTPVLPRPRGLTNKLSLFTCILPLLQHCGHSLHYAKDIDKPPLSPQLLLNPSIYWGKEDRSTEVSDSNVRLPAVWWAQILSFFLLCHPQYINDMCSFKVTSWLQQQQQKSTMSKSRERKRDWFHSFLSVSQETSFSNSIEQNWVSCLPLTWKRLRNGVAGFSASFGRFC